MSRPLKHKADAPSAERTSPHLRWPIDRFYWSLLEAPAAIGTGPLPAGLVPVFEEDVPLGGEPIHAVCTPAGDGRIAVCAAPLAVLEALPPGALSLCPEGVSGCLGGGIDPGALNLLVGALEPRPLRRARARRHLLAAAAVLASSALVSLGLVRRATHWNAIATGEWAATAAAMSSASVNELSLPRELDTLRRAASTQKIQAPSTPDAAPAMAALLAGWPAQAPSKPQSIAVDGTSAWVELSVEGDPSAFLKALKVPQGWLLQEPRLNTAGSLTRLSLSLHRAAEVRP